MTFDIDANGILNVSAKDKATGKEQKVVIEPASGLSEAEIERMVARPKQHAAEDARRREEAELKNRADNLAYAAERLLRESGDRLPSELKLELDNQTQAVRRALDRNDAAAIRLRSRGRSNGRWQRADSAVGAGAGRRRSRRRRRGGGGDDETPPGTVEGEYREV